VVFLRSNFMANFNIPTEFPFSLRDVRTEFDRLMDRVWHAGLTTAPLDGQDWAPVIDVVDEGKSYLVRAEVPGLSAEEVEVSIHENVLTIKGFKPGPAQGGEGRRQVRNECRYGSFLRRYEFPSPVQEEAVSATCKRGVLEVVIPKKTETAGRKVRVSSAE
jgi:HSP20 family protein